jgi:hypothetical protein
MSFFLTTMQKNLQRLTVKGGIFAAPEDLRPDQERQPLQRFNSGLSTTLAGAVRHN